MREMRYERYVITQGCIQKGCQHSVFPRVFRFLQSVHVRCFTVVCSDSKQLFLCSNSRDSARTMVVSRGSQFWSHSANNDQLGSRELVTIHRLAITRVELQGQSSAPQCSSDSEQLFPDYSNQITLYSCNHSEENQHLWYDVISYRELHDLKFDMMHTYHRRGIVL